MKLNCLVKKIAGLAKFKDFIKLKKAFSLNDLSVMLSTVMVVTATSVAITSIKNDSKKAELDQAKFERINKSLGKYLVQNKRLPCPASLKVAKGSSIDYGKEQIDSSGNCIIGNGVFRSNTNSNLLYGAVPVQSLGLKPEDLEDQYGSKISYVVDIKTTIPPSIVSNVSDDIGSIKGSSIIVQDKGATVNDVKSTSEEALFVLVSAGKNKEGAFNANSTIQNPINANSLNEVSNVAKLLDSSTVELDNVFVKSESKTNSNFDDKLFFKTKSDFLEESKAEFIITCKDAGILYGNKNAFFGEIVYANSNCVNSLTRPAKKCTKNGEWIQEVSCPCAIVADGLNGSKLVSNGNGGVKCDSLNYSGILEYNCNEFGIYSISQGCKQNCLFSATGVNQVTINSGLSKVDCNQTGFNGGYIVRCENGISFIQSGGCSDSKCASIGGYSGMRLINNVNSGTSSTFGICETGFSGFYSYTCENAVSTVIDSCNANCSFSLTGAISKTLTHGNHIISCDTGYNGSGVSVNCADGKITIKSNDCSKNDKCIVGVGNGMVSKEVVADGVIKTDGTCKSGFSGNYSYKCISTSVSETTNNCVQSSCEVGNALGLIAKTVSNGTFGSDGQCAIGFGGFYKWSCSSSGVGAVIENNCKNSCIVGGTNGMLQQVVSFGKSGSDGLCDISQGYVGNYEWSCGLNPLTNKVEGKIIANYCNNLCTVGTSSQGVGMVQKQVALNSSGNDGQCNSSNGYIGSYSWKCDSVGNSIVISNNCKNSCIVGTLVQGKGMLQKTVNLNTAGADGLCDDSLGYVGSYSWSCESILINNIIQAVGKVSQNNCQIKNCVVGGSNGMVAKTVNASSVGSNGTCSNGYLGSYSWSCNGAGVGSITANNCVPITCSIPAGTGYTARTLSFGSGSFTCDSSGYTGNINYNCNAQNTANLSGSCSPLTCSITGVNGISNQQVLIGTGSIACQSGFSGSINYECTCDKVFAYNEPNYTGTVFGYGIGSYGCWLPNGNDTISSLKVPSGLRVELCYHCGFVSCGIFYTSSVSLSGSSLDNNASCLRVANTGVGCNSPVVNTMGSCNAITCSLPAANGYDAQSNLSYTATAGSGTIQCSQAGYSGIANYTCQTSGTAIITKTCDCATGYIKNASGACNSPSQSITCTIPSSANTTMSNNTVNYTTTPVQLSCAPGYYGSPKYTCTENNNSSTGLLTFSGIPCNRITCYAKEIVGFSGTNYVDIVEPSSVEFMVLDNSRCYIDLRMGASALTLTNRIKLFDIYHGPLTYNYQDIYWSFYGPIPLTNISQSSFSSNFRSASWGYAVSSNHVLTKYARILDYGTSSFQCDSGYTGTLTYNCQTDGSILNPSSGSCN